MSLHRRFANQLPRNFTKLIASDATPGAILIFMAVLAMIIANSAIDEAYFDFFRHKIEWSPISKLDTVHLWINDGLMTIFFLVVGLEIKREIIDGELSVPAKRRLPVLAAVSGMVVPALIYLSVAGSAMPLQRGWAIPAATDIAFAVGVIGLLGRRVPPALRLFLLTVAIVDDLGAVLIIAAFYTAKVDLAWASGALLFLAGLILVGRRPVNRLAPTAALAAGLWYCTLNSGIHPTIAGVACAFAIPLKPDRRGDSLLVRIEHALLPWSNYGIVPLFGFANAGVSLAHGGLAMLLAPLPLGVAFGLFAGKQLGIFAALYAADRTGLAPRPQGATWPQIWGVTILSGIGLTMSLFIAALAFPAHPQLVEEAKIGVLAGSLLSSVLGYAVLRLAKPAAAPAGGEAA